MTVSTYILQNLFETGADGDYKKTDIFLGGFCLDLHIHLFKAIVYPICNPLLGTKPYSVKI